MKIAFVRSFVVGAVLAVGLAACGGRSSISGNDEILPLDATSSGQEAGPSDDSGDTMATTDVANEGSSLPLDASSDEEADAASLPCGSYLECEAFEACDPSTNRCTERVLGFRSRAMAAAVAPGSASPERTQRRAARTSGCARCAASPVPEAYAWVTTAAVSRRPIASTRRTVEFACRGESAAATAPQRGPLVRTGIAARG
jgi:hypothetical protein